MPDFAVISDVSERKKAFFDFLLPYIDEANEDADGLATANGFSEVGTSGSSGGANGAGLIVASKGLASIGSSLSPTFGTWASDGHASRMFNLKRDIEVTKTYGIDAVFEQLDRQVTYGIDAFFGTPPSVTWQGYIPQPLF